MNWNRIPIFYIISGVVLLQNFCFAHRESLVGAYHIIHGEQGTVVALSPTLLFRIKPASTITNSWEIEPNNRKKRFKREKLSSESDNTYAFGNGYSSSVRERFRKEKEEYRKRNGGFLPPSACPGRRPYIFYCDPRHRTGPINPATGQPWPNGMYYPPLKKSLTWLTTSTSTSAPLLRPLCDSILCPVGGNEGYGYTGLEDVLGQTKQHLDNGGRGKDCGSLLCIPSSLRVSDTS